MIRLDYIYKGWHVHLLSYLPNPLTDSKWAPLVKVWSLTTCSVIPGSPSDIGKTYPSREEADDIAFSIATDWIDKTPEINNAA